MRILFFSTYYYPYISGLTTYTKKLFNELAKNNDITILTFPHKEHLTNVSGNPRITYLPYSLKLSKGFISPQSIIYFLKEVLKNDLVILNIPNFEGVFLALIAKIFGKKIVSIFHCQVFLNSNLMNKIINFFLNLSVFIQLYLSNNIVAYTKDYFSSLKLFKFFHKKTVYCLPPVASFKPSSIKSAALKKMKGKDLWVGYAGRIASEKGLEYLISAIKKMKNTTLVFAGPYGKKVVGEEDYYNKIKIILKETKIKHLFLDNLFGGELSAFYRTIDVLVLPSINKTEAFGMVQAEAMLQETPVIASNLPGVRVPIRLTQMGILVTPKSSDEINVAIKKIVRSGKQFINKTSIANAKKIFDIKQFYRIYNDLLLNDKST